MNWKSIVRTLLLALAVGAAGCAHESAPTKAPVIVLEREGAAILARLYDESSLTQSLARYGLQREAIEAEVLQQCAIAYSIVQRTQQQPQERAKQLQSLHGTPYYIAEENRCAESLLAEKTQAQQWQRIRAGEWQAGEVMHLGRFDNALDQFNAWALTACPAKQDYVSRVFASIEHRILRQQNDLELLRNHYREPKRLARVLSWHSGRRAEDYQALYRRAERLADDCRVEAEPIYSGLKL